MATRLTVAPFINLIIILSIKCLVKHSFSVNSSEATALSKHVILLPGESVSFDFMSLFVQSFFNKQGNLSPTGTIFILT